MLLGYIQVDEPNGTSVGQTPADLSDMYSKSKIADPTHPVILNHYHHTNTWYPYCDIFSWDLYTFQDQPLETAYTRATCVFLWERNSFSSILSYIAGGDLDNASKPVLTVLQGNVIPYTIGLRNYAVPTRQEARCLAYTAITTGVRGISWWTYSIPWKTPDYGMMTNNTKLQEYLQLVRELKSINSILVSPTVSKSYEYLKETDVTFSPDPTISLDERNRQILNYILKSYAGKQYLIVVNKSNKLISNIKITISGLSGSTSAITKGLETTGSSKAGRSLSVVNGSFTDSFDGYAAHIYEIGGCPGPTIDLYIP